MTLPEVDRLFGFWKREFPLTIVVRMVASALGIKFPEPDDPDKPKRYMTQEEFQQHVAATNGGKAFLGGV